MPMVCHHLALGLDVSWGFREGDDLPAPEHQQAFYWEPWESWA